MKTQAVGRFRIDRVVESEGPFSPLDFILPGLPAELVAANADWLSPVHVEPGTGKAVMSFHAYVIRTGRHTILVDSCVGNDKERPLRPNWHRARFPFLAALAAQGLKPEDIDVVCCTHLHADHVGWNTRLVDGRWTPTFANARYVFAKREYQHWAKAHKKAVAEGLEVPNHGSFADSVLPVVEAGRAILVDDDHQIEDGVWLEPAPGHTPGTCIVHARDRDDHAVFLGDILHNAAQLLSPRQSSRFCSDPVASGKMRAKLVDRYAETDTVVLTGHFPTPTAGRIVRHANAFRFDMAI
jgi:glyoxylase-like metal-dependent hydrolase (beta-lactamase superfamily II)